MITLGKLVPLFKNLSQLAPATHAINFSSGSAGAPAATTLGSCWNVPSHDWSIRVKEDNQRKARQP